MKGRVFIAIDGNGIGRILEGYILNEQFQELKAFSQELSRIVKRVQRYIESRQGEVMMAGGDNLLAYVEAGDLPEIYRYVSRQESDILHFSIGVGRNSAAAYLALKYAKTMCVRYASFFRRFSTEPL